MTKRDLRNIHAELMRNWQTLGRQINRLEAYTENQRSELSYVEGVWQEGTEEKKMFDEICEVEDYLNTMSRYFN
ncbi:MAG: hypothetical protein IJQ57_00845 [Synergistaceae bacterium]|nr:hypothetical protein [Synergistaceae bacterium]